MASSARAQSGCANKPLIDTLKGDKAATLALTLWDPDFNGPQVPVLVVGGRFSAYQGGAANLATWNGVQWGSIGTAGPTGVDPTIMALAVASNGDLIVGGKFSSIGGVSASNIARWNGTTWLPLGGGIQSDFTRSFGDDQKPDGVRAIAVLANGHILAGGVFTHAGSSLPVSNIALWNGSAWQDLDTGLWYSGSLAIARVNALVTLPNGDFAVGGMFDTAGGNVPGSEIAVHNLVRWNASSGTWSSLGGGVDSEVFALAHGTVNGQVTLAVGGYFYEVGVEHSNPLFLTSPFLARLDYNDTSNTSGAWKSLGTINLIEEAHSLLWLPNGDLVVGSGATLFASPVLGTNGVQRWSPNAPANEQWSTYQNGLQSYVFDDAGMALAVLPTGELIVGGMLESPEPNGPRGIAKWDGIAWRKLHAFSEGVRDRFWPDGPCDFIRLDDGSIVACGSFTTVNDIECNGVARWDGQEWHPLGPGLKSTIAQLKVCAMTLVPKPGSNGMMHDLMVGGFFESTADNSVTLNNVAIWDGATWKRADHVGDPSSVNVGFDEVVNTLHTVYNAQGAYVGTFAGGLFTRAGSSAAYRIAKWTGSDWEPLKDGDDQPLPNIFGFGQVFTLASSPNGNMLYVGGDFINSVDFPLMNGIVKTPVNAPSWMPIAHGLDSRVNKILVRANGNVIAGGEFSRDVLNNTLLYGVAEWNGTAWSAIGDNSGVDGRYVADMAFSVSEKLLVAGAFVQLTQPNGDIARNIAEWDGSSWQPLGAEAMNGPTQVVNSVHVIDGREVLLGGSFSQAWDLPVSFFARWSYDGKPVIVSYSNSSCVSGTVTIKAVPASGYDFGGAVVYAWKRNVVEVLTDGATGWGSSISGSSTPYLTIAGFTQLDTGTYTLTATNSCGEAASLPIVMTYSCPADINGSCSVEVQDIFDFLNYWFAVDIDHADFNGDLAVTVQDIFDFLDAWFTGC